MSRTARGQLISVTKNIHYIRPLVKSVLSKIKFLISQSKHMGTQKNRLIEISSFEHPSHMLKLTDTKIFTIVRSKCTQLEDED